MKRADNKTEIGSAEREIQYLRKISERDAAKILALDAQSITIRHELELKRRGFALLAELSVSLRHGASYEGVFVPAARRINAALNMQRTAVLMPSENGGFKATVLQGYPQREEELIKSRSIEAAEELLDPARPALVTGGDPAGRLAEFRRAVGIPYFVSSPILLHDNSVTAILVTGRTAEEPPFLSRLGPGDTETVQAISALLGTVLVEKALVDSLSKARDLAEKSAKVKGEFLANMSHELHTPMNAILGMAHMLSRSEITDEQRQNVDHIMQSTRLLLRVFNDILDYSNLDTGRMTLRCSPFQVRDIAGHVRAALKEQARNKSLFFDVTVEPDVPETVLGDPARTEQVLFNLADNAIKFTDSGGVRVRVAKETNARQKIQLLFEVQDTGIGMDEEAMESLFLPFTQADASYTRKHGGSGLGLTICKHLADLMRGGIRCESRAGEGSKFTFTAPFELPERALEQEPGDGGEDDLESLRGLRVLLVEDNEVNQLVVGDMLSAAGVETTMAGNGAEALKAMENNEYDLVLMDIQMPEMDGLTATARIRVNPKYKDLPVIALTAHSLPEDREASLKSGMNDHLTKPIEPDQLYSALRQWIRETGHESVDKK